MKSRRVPRHPHAAEVDRLERARRALVKAWLPLDIPAFVKQVKALPVWRDCPRSIVKTEVRIAYAAYVHGGYAHGGRFVRIRISPASDLAWIMETVVHELVHSALPAGTVHNERFRRTLARAVRELWGIEIDPNPRDANGRVGKYALDRLIEAELRALIDKGLEYPKRAPSMPAEDLEPTAEELERKARRRKEVAAELVEKRRAHAIKMLARAERRRKLAVTVERKWRRKVQGYERRAARGGKP